MEEIDSTSEESLDNFRRKWKQEILSSQTNQTPSVEVDDDVTLKSNSSYEASTSSGNSTQNEDKASEMYLEGVKYEQNGDMLDAIKCYKRAMQLVPDIEELIYTANHSASFAADKVTKLTKNVNLMKLSSDKDDTGKHPSKNLYSKLLRIVEKDGRICIPRDEPKTTHISALPREIIVNLLKWVISSDLDLKSLEQVALVCRGFYVCCRDKELWKLACVKIWDGMDGPHERGYGSWREMFISRPRLHFNGCYISKTSYVRPGENSFQDSNYKPWHSVSYFRYLRFYCGGSAVMLTTADGPNSVVGQLKKHSGRHPSLLQGTYVLHGNNVTAVFKRKNPPPENVTRFRRKRDQNNNHGNIVAEQTFQLELEITSRKNRLHCTLNWQQFSVKTLYLNGETSFADFDVPSNKFPPFWFSTVRSYTAESDRPLELTN